ncbi:tautomerase family protein [Vagococcus penaei]|uniref:Tautomerase family protein n=1 Tax=Vagococcus penaei TaxID=633807 RepID=A0A1Q2D4Q4_9ENTE|nr:tautomerase family protein [Vagococcus penaei]AQP53376.1 tautomerase family protein [Vagococcus penaei]RST99699.1 tautomerase family protein [Vagococcus penaei]
MPLVKFDLIKGRTPEEIKQLLDISHKVFVAALDIPEGDRYQVVTQHEPYELIMEDTGLGFSRTEKQVLITIVSRPRTQEQKVTLYKNLQKELAEQLALAPEDIMVNFVINSDDDWSFAFGQAQFLTGDLS